MTKQNLTQVNVKRNSSCSFCLRTYEKLQKNETPFVKGLKPSTYICRDCANKTNAFLYNYQNIENDYQYTTGSVTSLSSFQQKSFPPLDMTPKSILQYLNDAVVGHDSVKKKLSTLFYNHYEGINKSSYIRNNALILGPSGTGKTMMVEMLSDYLNLSFISVSATDYTSAGYHGKDVVNIIQELFEKSDFSKEKTESGIVFIDEIDKIRTKHDSNDVNGAEVQRSLLRLMSGTDVLVFKDEESFYIDTKNILFVCAGAFDGLDKINLERTGKARTIGFISGSNTMSEPYNYDDLMKYGMIEELLGRMPILLQLNHLTKAEYVDIIKNSNKSIFKQYKNLFEEQQSTLTIKDEAIDYLVQKMTGKLGVRVLQSIFYNLLSDPLFDLGCGEGQDIYIIDVNEQGLMLI
jgi:ATP-dependent Clp protease ATP-binding subunit ClpX